MSLGVMIDGLGDPVTDLFREIVPCKYGKTLCVEGPDVLALVLVGPRHD